MGIKTVIKEMGLRDGAWYCCKRVLEALSAGRVRLFKYYLVAQPIGLPGSKPIRPDASITLRSVAAGDALEFAFPRPPAVLAMRRAAGAACTAALVRGEFAGFIWIQRCRYEEDELRCSYFLQDPVRTVWDYDVYVEPKYRVGRTMARLWSHVDAELAATGVRWSFSRISAFNPASLASHARLGIVRCGSALFLRVGPVQLSWVPQFPFLHLSFTDDRAPQVHLRPPP